MVRNSTYTTHIFVFWMSKQCSYSFITLVALLPITPNTLHGRVFQYSVRCKRNRISLGNWVGWGSTRNISIIVCHHIQGKLFPYYFHSFYLHLHLTTFWSTIPPSHTYIPIKRSYWSSYQTLSFYGLKQTLILFLFLLNLPSLLLLLFSTLPTPTLLIPTSLTSPFQCCDQCIHTYAY